MPIKKLALILTALAGLTMANGTYASDISTDQAVKSATKYLEIMGGFSRKSLITQLEYEGFTAADAAYAVNAINPDWNEQAVISARKYLGELGGFSRKSLAVQLRYEGFTAEQTTYAINEVYK